MKPPTSNVAHLLKAYQATLIEVQLPSGDWVYDPSASWTGLPPELESASQIWIITAWNPFSEVLPEAENRIRNIELCGLLEASKAPFFPAVGRSPDGQWQESSFAVVGLPWARVKELAQQFGQHAVFRIENEQVTVDWTSDGTTP